jgi:hypothetical protein
MSQSHISASTATEADELAARQGLWPAIRRRVVLIVVLLVWVGGFFTTLNVLWANPLSQSISLDPPGIIDTEIWLPLPERYFIMLMFSAQGYSAGQIKQLLGDFSPGTGGVPIAISWSLTSSKTKLVVVQGAKIVKGPDRLVDTIRVEPGYYRFRAKTLSPVPQLASMPTRLLLWNSFKTDESWQSGVLLWGGLFTAWIVTPITAVFVLRLIWLVGLHYWHSKMKGSHTT